jgi:hypothetical protein
MTYPERSKVLLRVFECCCLAAAAERVDEVELMEPKLKPAGGTVMRQLGPVLLRPLQGWTKVVSLDL